MRPPSRERFSARALGGRARERWAATRPGGWLRSRGARGTAELSVVTVVGAMVAGVFFGQGISRTAVDIADGLTWLSDSPSGRVIQVNPATGQPEVALEVGAPGDALDLVQYDGQLYVVNQTTGQLMAFDLTSILISGQRRVASGGAVHTLREPGPDGALFLVDDEASTISAIDPVSTASIGTTWVSPAGLADAAMDDDGTLWTLEDDGALHELQWDPERLELHTRTTHSVDRSGPGSVLVSHPRGVTVFAPDEGSVAQIGTESTTTADAPKLIGDLAAPERAPEDLVPVAAPESSTVVVVTPGEVREVNLASVDCAEPGTPEVFRETVYVPCADSEKVVRLGADGTRAGDDIPTPGTTPELVLDDDSLIINAPGREEAVIVNGDGSVDTIVRDDPALVTTPLVPDAGPDPAGLQDALDDLLAPVLGDDDREVRSQPDDDRPSGTPTRGPGDGPTTGDPDGPGGSDGPGRGPGTDPSGGPSGGPGTSPGTSPSGDPTPCTRQCGPGITTPTTGPSDPPSGGPSDPGGSDGPGDMVLAPPSNVTAEAGAEGKVTVSWTHAGVPAEEFTVAFDGGTEVARVKGSIRQVVLSIPPGRSVAFVVTAIGEGRREASAASNIVTTSGVPGEPAQVTGSGEYLVEESDTVFRSTYVVTVRWGAAAANGAPVSRYDVSVSTPDGTQTATTDGAGRSASVQWTCEPGSGDGTCGAGGNFTATVSASNAVGTGPARTIEAVGPPQPAPPLPDDNSRIAVRDSTSFTGISVEGIGRTTLTLQPPTDWRTFTGVCEYTHSGNTGGLDTGPVDCDETSLEVPIRNGYIRDPDSGERTHTITFTATNNNGTARSATYRWTTRQDTLCERCDKP